MMPLFEEFRSIERIAQPVVITEKIHGTNAQIYIDPGTNEIVAGSRNRWLSPLDDNFGFAAWVDANKDTLKAGLGVGRHYGEWYGAGINAGYGLKEKRFALFDTHKWAAGVPHLSSIGVDVVPILYNGPNTPEIIDSTFQELKTKGSVLVPGYNKPEGIVVYYTRTGVRMKRTFEAEDTAWNYKVEREKVDYSVVEAACAPFWQPIRLEKLLSRDERFGSEYPSSLPALCKAYVEDLEKETEIADDLKKHIRKGVFKAIKGMMGEKGYTA